MQIIPWISVTHRSFLNFWLFTVVTTVALYCYLLSVLIDPGAVPKEYAHDVEDVTAMYIQVLNEFLVALLVRSSRLLEHTKADDPFTLISQGHRLCNA